MDVQSIGAASGVSASLQPTARTAPGGAEKTAAPVQKAAPVEETKAVSLEQTRALRDPRSLQYQVDSETHRVITTIVDERSDTVVVQVPSAELIRIARAIDRMQGFLVEDHA